MTPTPTSPLTLSSIHLNIDVVVFIDENYHFFKEGRCAVTCCVGGCVNVVLGLCEYDEISLCLM